MTRLGLDGLDVAVGAVRRGRLVLGLLVLHGVDDLVVGRRDGRARDGADDEDPEVAEVVRAACAELKFLGAFISIASTPTPSARHLLDGVAWRASLTARNFSRAASSPRCTPTHLVVLRGGVPSVSACVPRRPPVSGARFRPGAREQSRRWLRDVA